MRRARPMRQCPTRKHRGFSDRAFPLDCRMRTSTRRIRSLFVFVSVLTACHAGVPAPPSASLHPASPPPELLGRFVDDYGNAFDISAQRFDQLPSGRFHIAEWNPGDRFFIARNDTSNLRDGGRWTRVDWMSFSGMAPYTWGFCLTAYRAESEQTARATPPPKRESPRTGCNGFPFSRMKPSHAAPRE